MGGPGSGKLAKPGSGEKAADGTVAWLAGTAARRTKARPTLPPIQTFDAPAGLLAPQRAIWDRLAPHAFAARTLTRATEASFLDVIDCIVMRDEVKAAIDHDGLTREDEKGIRKHPLLTDYRGLYQRVEAGLVRFSLSPLAKPILPFEEGPADPFAGFEEPT